MKTAFMTVIVWISWKNIGWKNLN